MSALSRRQFVAAGTALASEMLTNTLLGESAPGAINAGEVIDRIQKSVGVPWFQKTVDRLLTATTETAVKGISTTMMATLDVIQRSVAAGCNMIVTHETPFYLHQDQTDDIQSNPTLLYKLDYCKQNNVALFHFHDHWHFRKPVDGIAQGMVNQLGWQKNVPDPADPKRLTFDGIPLAKFTQQMQQTLGARTIRVVGAPALPVRHVQTSWGYVGRETGIPILAKADVDVLICGETREWELVEYVQDSIRAGQKKALIVVGHVLSKQGGMILCRDWLKTFITEVPIQFIPATEPFWIPDHSVQS